MSVSEIEAEWRLVAALRATADWVAESEVGYAPAPMGRSDWPAEEFAIELRPAPARKDRRYTGNGSEPPRGRWALGTAIGVVACALAALLAVLLSAGPSGVRPADSGGASPVPASTTASWGAPSSALPSVGPGVGSGLGSGLGLTSTPSAGLSGAGSPGSTATTP